MPEKILDYCSYKKMLDGVTAATAESDYLFSGHYTEHGVQVKIDGTATVQVRACVSGDPENDLMPVGSDITASTIVQFSGSISWMQIRKTSGDGRVDAWIAQAGMGE